VLILRHGSHIVLHAREQEGGISHRIVHTVFGTAALSVVCMTLSHPEVASMSKSAPQFHHSCARVTQIKDGTSVYEFFCNMSCQCGCDIEESSGFLDAYQDFQSVARCFKRAAEYATYCE
jgi:hypothetical protein